MFNTSDIFMHEEESTFNLTDISLLSDNSSSQDSSSNYDDSLGSFLYSLDALVSPFTLSVVGCGLLISLLISAGFCIVCRINSARSPEKTEGCNRSSVRSDNWSGRFDCPQTEIKLRTTVNNPLPYRRLQESQRSSLSTSSLHRNPSFSTPYCLSSRPGQTSIYSTMTPVTTLATPASLAAYPVVTPTATSFARHSPVSTNFSSLFPGPNHSNYCTAGLYQTRLRSPPRPLSCIAGLSADRRTEIPKVKLSTQPPVQARYERDYMSIAEVTEQKASTVEHEHAATEDDDDEYGDDPAKRNSVFI